MEKNIFIAEDDADIRNLLQLFLENEGYSVRAFETCDALLEAFVATEAELVVLDIMMPGTGGLEVCRQLRAKSTVPIIILTAKDTDADFVAGMTYGSDDYLVKPFSPTQLSMRIKALLRRVEMSKAATSDGHTDVRCGSLLYDARTHTVKTNTGDVGLTGTELALLLVMMKHCGDVISRETLLEQVWGISAEVETRVTDETVRRVRKKLRAAQSDMVIANKWGYGYRLQAGDES